MKQRFYLLAILTVLVGAFSSCKNKKTYAELLADENASIKTFMEKRGYTVSKVIPPTVPWPDGVFYKTKSGMYIHVQDTGVCVIDTIVTYTPITIRYREYDMNDTLLRSNMFTTDTPPAILYNHYSSTNQYEDCLAWHEALHYVGDRGYVFIIAPASVGWSAYSDDVLARYYELRYTFWK